MLALLVLLAATDGWYCATADYLAFDTFDSGAHQLVVMRPDGTRRELALPEVQVLGMSCGSEVVTIAAWDRLHVVSLADGKTATAPLQPLEAKNLAEFSAGLVIASDYRTRLPWRGYFDLRTRVTPTFDPCRRTVETTIEQRVPRVSTTRLLRRTFARGCE